MAIARRVEEVCANLNAFMYIGIGKVVLLSV
jgi:hypothetical protein